MAEYTLPHFGTIPLENPEEYYQVSINFKGGGLKIDLNFENRIIDIETLANLKNFIEHIGELSNQNKAHLLNGYEHGHLIKEYIDFHLEELQQDKLEQLIDYGNKEIVPAKQLFNKLRLERIGLYPNRTYEESFAVFDYTLEGNIYIDGRRTITDQIIAVKTNENGKLEHITWES